MRTALVCLLAVLVGLALAQTSETTASTRPILWLSVPGDGLYMATQTASGFFPEPQLVVNKSHVTRPFYDSSDGKLYTTVSDDGFETDGQIVSMPFPPAANVYDATVIQDLGGVPSGVTWVVADGEYVYWNEDKIALQRVKKNATPSSVCANCFVTSVAYSADNVVFVADDYVYSTTDAGSEFGIARVGPLAQEVPNVVQAPIVQDFPSQVCVIDATYDYKEKLVWITTQSPGLSGTYVSRVSHRLGSSASNIELADAWQTYSIAIDSSARIAYASQINSTACVGFSPCNYETIPDECPGRIVRWNIDEEQISDAVELWRLPHMAYQIGFWSPSQEAQDEGDSSAVFWIVSSIVVGVGVLGVGGFFVYKHVNDPERNTPTGKYSKYVRSLRSKKVEHDSFARNAFTIIDTPDSIPNKESRISVWDESGRGRAASNMSTASETSAETTEGNAFDPALYQSIKSVNLGKDRDGVDIIKAGFLQMWEPGMLFGGVWKKRWFVLTKVNIRWYDDDPRETDQFAPVDQSAVEDLMNVVINASFEDIPHGYCFDLVGSKRTLTFQASSKFESTEWKDAMWDMIAEVHFPHRASQQAAALVDPGAAKAAELENASKAFAAVATKVGEREASDTVVTVDDPTIGDTLPSLPADPIPSLPAETTTPSALADAAKLALTMGIAPAGADAGDAGDSKEDLPSSVPSPPAPTEESTKSSKSSKSTKSKRSKKGSKRGSKHSSKGSKGSKGSRKGSKSSKGSRGSRKKGGSKHKSAKKKEAE